MNMFAEAMKEVEIRKDKKRQEITAAQVRELEFKKFQEEVSVFLETLRAPLEQARDDLLNAGYFSSFYIFPFELKSIVARFVFSSIPVELKCFDPTFDGNQSVVVGVEISIDRNTEISVNIRSKKSLATCQISILKI